MTDEFLRTQPNFKANLTSLHTTPTTFKDENFDYYVAYAFKNLEQLSTWQKTVFVSSNSNSTFSNLHNMILKLTPTISPQLF